MVRMRKLLSAFLILATCGVASTTSAGAVPDSGQARTDSSTSHCRTHRPASPHGFGDVESDAFYNDSVSWLVESGITGGVAPGHFRPGSTVDRGQMAAFLWRLKCQPTPIGSHSFSDVSPTAYYNTAVSWLAEARVVVGTGAGRYSPDQPVTRGEMA